MRKFLFLLGTAVLLVGLHESGYCQVADHAAPKTAKAGLSLLKLPVKAVRFLATHPISSLKDSAGAFVFGVEDGIVDPLHAGFAAADAATNVGQGKYFGVVHYVFHVPDVVLSKTDSDFEAAERYLFGSSN